MVRKLAYRRPHIPDLRRMLTRVQSEAKTILIEGVREWTRQEKDHFIRRIEEQDFGAFITRPLSPAYLKRKIRKGLDPRVMIATRHYLSSIRVFEKRTPTGIRLYVGFASFDRAKDDEGNLTDLPLHTLAEIHEYGTSRTPRRPHWRPHYKLMRRLAPDFRLELRRRIAAKVRELRSTL